MNQTFLSSLRVSNSYQWRLLIELIKPVCFERWINRRYLTLLEFGFILSGFEPVPNEFLIKVLEELREVLHNINRKASFQDIAYSDKTFLQDIRELFPFIKKEDDIKERILKEAQFLLDSLEVIHRGMLTMSQEYKVCFSAEQGSLKERLWHFEFLVYWAKSELRLSLPIEIIHSDRSFNLEKYLIKNLEESVTPKHQEDGLMDNGWFNLNQCRAPKLRALIHCYVKEEELCKANPSRTFSTGNIVQHLKADYEIVGASGTDHDNFLDKLSYVASLTPSGASLKKRDTNKKK